MRLKLNRKAIVVEPPTVHSEKRRLLAFVTVLGSTGIRVGQG
jgi:hypothetical protein